SLHPHGRGNPRRYRRRIAEQRMEPGDLPGGLGIGSCEYFEATRCIDRGELAAGRSHGCIDGVAGAQCLAASLARAMAAGERVRAVDGSLHRALLLRDQPVADGERALLIEAQLLSRRRRQDVGHGILLLGRRALRALAQAAQEVLGGWPGPAHLANMMELLAD